MDEHIEDIPQTMERFLGCKGKMVKPTPSSVKPIVAEVEAGYLITLGQIRERLAIALDVQTACPAATLKCVVALANDPHPIGYWRVIKNKGELIKQFPGGFDNHGFLLQSEGLDIDFNRKTPVVVGFESKLAPVAS